MSGVSRRDVSITFKTTREGANALDTRAEREERDRSSMIRLMLRYAEQHMPKGWTP